MMRQTVEVPAWQQKYVLVFFLYPIIVLLSTSTYIIVQNIHPELSALRSWTTCFWYVLENLTYDRFTKYDWKLTVVVNVCMH